MKSPEVHEEQTAAIYRAIGKAVVAFEHVTFRMQTAITLLLADHGLKNQQLSQVMLAELTAAPLKSILQAIVGELSVFGPADQRLANSIFSRAQRLIEKRNEIVHCTWFVGWASESQPDVSDAAGHRLGRSKAGAAVKSPTFRAEDFLAFAEECELVGSLIDRVWLSVSHGFELSKQLAVDEKGNVVCRGTS